MSTVLVVAPHPDDEILGCGGVMARHVAQGDIVNVLVATRGMPEVFPVQEIEEGRRELRKAHDLLGIAHTTFLDFPAPALDTVPGYKLADAIGNVVGSLKPSVVYLPHLGDIHVDHRAVAEATLVATRPINNCSVRRLLCYETLSETEWGCPGHEVFAPTVFADISEHLTIKLEAIKCYQSQLKQPPHPRSLEAVELLARLRGATVGLPAAEAFMLLREIEV